MVSIHDVAADTLDRKGPLTTWKLQKLADYCQAWSLIWDDDILFPEEIEAWVNGRWCVSYTMHIGASIEFQVCKKADQKGFQNYSERQLKLCLHSTAESHRNG